jgi:hypothetical protein
MDADSAKWRCGGSRISRSSAKAGLETARHILERIDTPLVSEDEVGDEGLPTEDRPPVPSV